MCEPTTILGIAGIAFSVMGQFQQMQANRDAAEMEAAVMRNNQTINENLAKDALARGTIAEAIKRRETKQLIGIQRAALAGSNVEVDTGSALETVVDTAGIGEYEARVVRANAEREAYAYRTRASNYGAQAQLSQMKADSSVNYLALAGTALSGASTVHKNYAILNKNKVADPWQAGWP